MSNTTIANEPITTNSSATTGAKRRARLAGWTRAARSPWTVVCAVAIAVLGPAATSASVLDLANKAPLHHAVRVDQNLAYIPTDSNRRKVVEQEQA